MDSLPRKCKGTPAPACCSTAAARSLQHAASRNRKRACREASGPNLLPSPARSAPSRLPLHGNCRSARAWQPVSSDLATAVRGAHGGYLLPRDKKAPAVAVAAERPPGSWLTCCTTRRSRLGLAASTPRIRKPSTSSTRRLHRCSASSDAWGTCLSSARRRCCSGSTRQRSAASRGSTTRSAARRGRTSCGRPSCRRTTGTSWGTWRAAAARRAGGGVGGPRRRRST